VVGVKTIVFWTVTLQKYYTVTIPKIKILRSLECFFCKLFSFTAGKSFLDVISCKHLSITRSVYRICVELHGQILRHPTHTVFVKEQNW
jgi:hypothetical protein